MRRRSRIRLLALTGALVLAGGGVAVVNGVATAAPSGKLGKNLPQSLLPAVGTKSVSYLGHAFTVPAGWSVVDLSKKPSTCVRFDVHALYLGTPSHQQSCGAQTAAPVGGAILVQPAKETTAASAEDSPIERRITATLPNATIIASYGATDRAQVVRILTGSGVPTPKVDATPSTSTVQSAVRGNLSAYPGPITPSVVAEFTQNAHGTGFDTCDAPSTSDMAAWGTSPFMAIGVYFGGSERNCPQENLTASWVSAVTAAGWHLLPLYIGLQVANGEITPATDPAAQGKAAADDAATQASSLGIGQGAVLYYNMEDHNITGAPYSADDITATQEFISAWTTELHALGYESGLYGNEDGAQGAIVAGLGKAGMVEPDMMDVANWNSRQDDDPGSDPANHWALHRVHQFLGPTVDGAPNSPTYGGVTINIDEDFFNLGQVCGPALTSGTTVVQPRDSAACSRLAAAG